MKKYILLIVYCLFYFTISAQNHVAQFNKTVSFIYISSQNDEYNPIGTGFLVSVPTKRDSTLSLVYFVTAKHVIQNSNGDYLNTIYPRFNTKDGLSQIFKTDLVSYGIKKNVYVHSDETIDLVIIPVVIPNNVDYKHIPINQFINRDNYKNENVNVGTEVFFTGLFTPYIGSKTINPIFRFGRICLIPNEKIEFAKVRRDIILIESSTFGGNSGSPVIFTYKNKVGLGGVILGSFNNNQVFETDVSKVNIFTSNLGISAITPSEFIIEILNSPELTKIRM